MAEAYEPALVNFPTSASATITVDFGGLVLKDASGNNITSLVGFSVTPPAGIPTPEPGSLALAAAGLLALAVRPMPRRAAQSWVTTPTLT